MRRIREVFKEELNRFSKDIDLAPDEQEEILAFLYSKDHGATRSGKPIICSYIYCEDCRFWQEDDCSGAMYDWLMEEL